MAALTAGGELEDGSDSGVSIGGGTLPDATKPSPPLPTGVVTFVMTDIEGSTRLFRTLGDSYVEVLSTHNALLRTAFGNRGGVEVGTEGDSLLVAFPQAAGALAACLDGQRALVAQRWPPGVDVRVRMGVHTGEATPVGHDYVALTLHQVARICSGAHGGQVLASEATVADAGGRLPPGSSLTPLGSFQLRGFPTPALLFQLRHPDLRSEFPPLRTIGVVAHNLPFLRAKFVGRAEERATLADVLQTTGVVSVVGTGGVGKTRLAVQVAFDVMDGFSDGAWLVEFAPVTDPASVPRVVAAAVGVAEQPGRSADESLLEALGPKSILLILDNCEHLLDAIAGLAERLSQHCPHLVILTTSREPLEIEGEVVWRVEPLQTVDPNVAKGFDELAAADAVQLFGERAALVNPGFRLTEDNVEEVARIVSRVNGLPLAIELAAAALGERSLRGVSDGLSDRFALLTRGRRTAPGRHQTLRAALEWSLDLLRADERRLFARLAVFAGSFTTEAVVELCAGAPVDGAEIASLLRRLVRSSLLNVTPELPDRWSMLESIRELAALELTAAGEADDLYLRHRTWFAARVEAVGDDIGRTGHASVMRELAADHDNVRRAIENAMAAGEVDIALRICTAMLPFWTSHGDWSEGCQHLAGGLTFGGGDEALRGRACAALGSLLLLRGELAEAETWFERARATSASTHDDVTLARSLAGSGYVAFRHSQLDRAEALWEEALTRAERAGNERVAASVLRSLAIVAGSSGQQARAGALLDRAIASAQRASDDQLLRLLLGSSAEMHLWLGHYEMAEDLYGDALTLATAIGDISARPLLLSELGWVALLRGDLVTAQRLSEEAAEMAEDLDSPRVLSHALRLSGESLIGRGDVADAAAAFDRALTVAQSLDAPAEVAGVRCSQAFLALGQGELDEARSLAEEAAGISALGHTMRRTSPGWVLGMVALTNGESEIAGGHFQTGLRRAEHAQIPRHEANNLWGLAGVSAAAGRHLEAADLHRRALELRRDIGDILGIVDSLVGLAAVTAVVEPKTAAELVSSAISLRTRAGAVPTSYEAAALAEAVAMITDVGGETVIDDAKDAAVDIDTEVAVATAVQLVARIEGQRSDRMGESGGKGEPTQTRA